MFQRIPVFRFSFLGADVMLMGLQKSEKATVFLCLLVILLFVAPLFVLGEDAHIRVHDNLDSNLAWYKVLTSSGGPSIAIRPEIGRASCRERV